MQIERPTFARYVSREEVMARAHERDQGDQALIGGMSRYPGDNLDEILDSAQLEEQKTQTKRYVSLAVGGLGVAASFAGLFVAVGGIVNPGVQTVYGLAIFGVSQFVARKAVNYSNGLEQEIADHRQFQWGLTSLVHYIGQERARRHADAVQQVLAMSQADRDAGGIEMTDEAVMIGDQWVPLS